MKIIAKLFLASIIFSPFLSVSGQQYSKGLVESTIIVNRGLTNNLDTHAKGSPYLNDTFMPATIQPLNKVYLVRYNAVDDIMEIQKDSKVLILNRNVKDYEINFNNSKQSIKVLENFETKDTGFFTVLKETPSFSLYRKDRKIYVEGKKASYSSLNATPNEFRNADSNYYIKIDKTQDIVTIIPKNRKKFIALFAKEHQGKIKSIIKENKISLNKEKDLIKLVNLLSDIVK